MRLIGRMRPNRDGETTAPERRSALASGILTGVSSLVLSGSAAVAAAILAQKFGRDAATDGFLAAYAVYVTVTLAAQALRLTAVPELTPVDRMRAFMEKVRRTYRQLQRKAAAVIREPIKQREVGYAR